MENIYRKAQIEKALYREKFIRRWIEGEKLCKLMKADTEGLTRARWWDLKKKYKSEGFWGLIDKRRGGRTKKVTEDIKKYIKGEKLLNPEIISGELEESVKNKFGEKISNRWIREVVKQSGERFHFGRPATGRRDYRQGMAIDGAGVYFLKGADGDLSGVETITKEIVSGREKEIEEKSALARLKGTRPETIKKKVETLLYLPMYEMQKPYHLLKYHKRGLGIVSGSGTRYSYYTTDIFLCDVEKLKVAKIIGDKLVNCYLEALCIEIELEDGSYFYIDGHAKHVWSDTNIPKAFFTTLKRAERGLHQYFIHSSKGDPLILLTCPGDTRLPGVIFNLIDAFENAVGKKIVKAAIFDREGLSLAIFKEFDNRKKYFITLLREDMYRGEESFKINKDFQPLKTQELDGQTKILSWVADAEYELKEKKNKEKRTVRVALVRKLVNEKTKLIPIITNIKSSEEPDIRRIANRYFDRWPYQENIFKEAKEALKVDTNHGYKKIEVPNRVLLRKKEELETNLRGITKKLEKATGDRESAEKIYIKTEELYNSEKQLYQKEINELYAVIGLGKTLSERQRQRQLARLKYLERKLRDAAEKYSQALSELKRSLENKEHYEKSLRTQKENKEQEIKNLDLDRALFEIKTEKDHLMSNFKTLLINLSSYAQRQYFPEKFHRWTLESMKKAFYQQDGYVKIKKKRIDVTLHSYDEPELQRAAEYACLKFNNSNLKTPEGQRIWMRVES